MASITYRPARRRWHVRWFPNGKAGGRRNTRVFRSESEARDFAATLPPARKRVPASPAELRRRIRAAVLVEAATGCWIWQPKGGGNHGYGQLSRTVGGRQITLLAHRFSYETFVGPIPEGLQIDHLCSTRRCVNPDHLEPVTQQENLRRRDARKVGA